MPHKSCLHCSKPFYTEDRNAKYCSRTCYDAVTGRPDAHNRICIVCGDTYSAYNRNSKYCSVKCYNKHRAIPSRQCLVCGKTFTPKQKNGLYCSVRCINRKLHDCECSYCGQTFHPRTASKSKFCSLDCYHASLASEYPRSRMNFSAKERRNIMERDGNHCVVCGATDNLEVDHILAICNGGTRSIDNGQTLCSSCHDKKTKRDKAIARSRSRTA